MYKFRKKSGYSLVEMVIYIAILSFVSFVVISMLLSFTNSYRTVTALRITEQSGIDSMERMTRDIRGAADVDTVNSTFGTSPGVLTVQSNLNGVLSTTTKFYVQGGILKVDVNGAYYGPLTLSNTNVSSLIFRYLDNGTTTAVKIDLTITGTVGTTTKVKNYHTTVVVRGK